MKKEVKIALVAIVALVMMFFGMNFLKGAALFQSQELYYVTFCNVSGVTAKSPVYADGVRVGVVGKIDYDYDHQRPILVQLLLDRNLRLPLGSQAEVSSDIMGNTQINLLMANNPRERVLPGDTIASSEGDGTIARLKAMVPVIEEMGPRVDSIVTNLSVILSDESIIQTLHNVQTISANLATTSQQLNQLMAQLNQSVPGLVSKADGALTDANVITSKLAAVDVQGIEGQVKGSLGSVQTTLAEVQTTVNSLNKTVENLHNMSVRLNNGEGTLGKLLTDDQLYDQLNSTVADADILVKDLKEHPKRYVHFSIFGKKDK